VLTGELEHRGNNTLAVVVAVVERTRENTQRSLNSLLRSEAASGPCRGRRPS